MDARTGGPMTYQCRNGVIYSGLTRVVWELNPVRAGMVGRANEWHWSSVHALLDPERGDGMTDTRPVLDRVPDFAALLASGEDQELSDALRRSETVGRPLGASAFLERVEAILGRDPTPQKRGPKPRGN